MQGVLGLDPKNYIPHALHRTDRAWSETNCYADLWIEILHAQGLDPHAMLAFTLGIDCEGDQWTFFKPAHHTLRTLYGLVVEELNVWRDLRTNTCEQLARGRLVLAEADAFFLPDTAATDYQRQHTKTTIGISLLDEAHCHYFHNAGFFAVSGADLAGLLAPRELPLFAELVKFDHRIARPPAELRALSRQTLRETLAFRPAANPFVACAAQLREVTTQGLAHWHRFAFANLRQCGAAFELARDYLRWLDPALAPAALACDEISLTSKSLILKGARAANAKRSLDANEALTILARRWDEVMRALAAFFA
jgi:hypothetical protein